MTPVKKEPQPLITKKTWYMLAAGVIMGLGYVIANVLLHIAENNDTKEKGQ